jgi:hypothetical protein
MLIGLIIGTIFAVVGLSQSFPKRHAPEPPNSRWKLPSLILMVVTCVAFTVVGPWPVVWAALAVVLLVEIGFVLRWAPTLVDAGPSRPAGRAVHKRAIVRVSLGQARSCLYG